MLGVSNLLDIPLEYEIVNDTMYFNLEYPEPDQMIEGQQQHLIRVVPNVKALLRNADNFRKVSTLFFFNFLFTLSGHNRVLYSRLMSLFLSLTLVL